MTEWEKLLQRCQVAITPGGIIVVLTANGPALLVRGLGQGKSEFVIAKEPTNA